MITLEAAQTLRGKASVASKVTVSVFGMELASSVETYKLLYQGQPGTGTSTLYTVPGATMAFIRSIHVVNNDTAVRSFKLYVGGTADANAIIPDISIPIGGLAVYDNDAWRIYDATGSLQETLNTGVPAPHHVSHEVAGSDAVTITHAQTTGQTAVDHHTNVNDPTANQKDALVGTGTPSITDKYVNDSDARNTNARTPTAHHASHDAGGGDAMVIDAAAATGSLRTLGTGAAQAAAGNDSRLSDARTPTAHHTSHEVGGGDAVAITHAQTTGQTANDHHNQAHVLAGADHTASGLTTGYVIRASGVSTFVWAQLQHTDLGAVGANDHHNQAHSISGADHTGTLPHTSLSSVGADDHHDHATAGADAEHTFSGQVISGVNASSSQKGHASFNATRLTVSSGAVDLATDGHGAAYHTDITRSLWITAASMAGNAMDSGSLTTFGTLPDRLAVVQLADAATQGFFFDFIMPADAKASSPISIAIYWAPGSTDASSHAVRWSSDFYVFVAGVGAGTAGTTTAFTGVSQANTSALLVIDTLTQVLASTNPGDIVRGNQRRLGADGADTYVGAINVVGIRVDYTATQ